MIPRVDPVPDTDKVVDRQGSPTQAYLDWFLNLAAVLGLVQRLRYPLSKRNQGALIATTAIDLGIIPAGLYEVQVRTKIARPATTSSSVIVTIGTTDGGTVVSYVGQDLNGNTAASAKSDTYLLQTDSPGFLTFAVAYASVGGVSALYDLDIIVKTVNQ